MPIPQDLTSPAVPGGRPSTSTRPDTSDGEVPIEPNNPWFYVHYGRNIGGWMVVEIGAGEGVPAEDVGTWWVPALITEPVKPGLNLHRTIRRGMPESAAYEQAHSAVRRNGGVVLPESLGYRVEVPARGPRSGRTGVYYADAWSSPLPKIGGQRQKFKFDRQRYYRWLLSLVREGVVDEPPENLLSYTRAKLAARIPRREALTDLAPEQRAAYVAEAKAAEEKAAKAKVAKQPPTRKAR